MRLTSLFFNTMVLTIRLPCFFQEAGDLLIRLGGGNDRLIRRISLHVDGATELPLTWTAMSISASRHMASS